MSSRLSHATSPLAQVGDEKMPMTRASPVITSNQDRWPLATTTMAATTASRPKQSKSVSKDDAPKTLKDQAIKSSSELAIEHLPPLMLIFTVLFCSGAIFVLAMRDFMSTGRVIAGEWDDAFMVSRMA